MPDHSAMSRAHRQFVAHWSVFRRSTFEVRRGGITTSEQARLEAPRQDLETSRRLAGRNIASFSLVAGAR